jgi:selenoprotein W-related protein
MIPGGGGVFDVKVNGELIYSKFRTGRFPTNEEIIDMVSRKRA